MHLLYTHCNDSKLNAKICDFGNSRVMDLDPDVTPETLTSLPGTLDFMPPEARNEAYDPSLDVFFILILSTFGYVCCKQLSKYFHLHTMMAVDFMLTPKSNNVISKIEEMLDSEDELVHLYNMSSQRPHAAEMVEHLQVVPSTMESQGLSQL